MQQPDLFSWIPACRVIPFPSQKRTGHARRVAESLSKARTNREADRILTQACRSFRDQMQAAGIPMDDIRREHDLFLRAIHAECDRIGAKWMPSLPEDVSSCGPTPGGAA